jgi:ATP-dependent DNA ligase
MKCKIKSIKKIESEPRYDIEIEDNNNFYANGILVHNCRLIASKDGLFSRNGKKYFSIPHIEKMLKPLFDVNPNLVLDGELYNHQFRDNFNKIISLVKKTKPSKEDLEESEELIQYWIYDCFDSTQKKMIFSDRFAFLLESVLPSFFDLSGKLKIVKTNLLKSKEEMYELYSKYIENGFEGQMIRINGKPYESKRVNHLLKHKSFMDAEFTIISIEEGQGNRSGMAGYITYKLPDNRTFDSSIKADVDTLKKLLIDRAAYVGGQGTVKFFNYTPDGKPRFPVTISLFKDKRDV